MKIRFLLATVPMLVAPRLAAAQTLGNPNFAGVKINGTPLNPALATATVGTGLTLSGGALGLAAGAAAGNLGFTPLNPTSNLSDLTSAAIARSNLGLGALATQASVNVASQVTGVLAPANGGLGTTSLFGMLKGNGSSAATVASAGTDYIAPGGALGTPSSGTATYLTGLPVSTGLAGAGTGVVAALAQATNGTNASSLLTYSATSAPGLALNLLPHVFNNTALAAYGPTAYPVVRDNFGTPVSPAVSDGGQAIYNWSSAACSIASGAGDGGTQIPRTAGGCWIVDPGTPITIELFAGQVGSSNYYVTPTIDATPALQKAANTGLPVHINSFAYLITADVLLQSPGQLITGDGPSLSRLIVTSAFSAASSLVPTGVAAVYVTNGGVTYSAPPAVAFSGGGCSNVTGTAVMTGSGSSQTVASVTVAQQGNGCTSAPTVSFSGGGGSGATATALLYGAVFARNPSVFNTSLNNQGPTIQNLSIYVQNSDVNPALNYTQQLSSLYQVSCLDFRDTISFRVSRVFFSQCMRGIDMRGGSGQAVINDIQSASYIADIDMDGSANTTFIRSHENYPYGLTTSNQNALMQAVSVAIKSGRSDDLKISGFIGQEANTGMLFYQGTAATPANNGYSSSGGFTSASITDANFDTIPVGINQSAGRISVNGGYDASGQAINLSGGVLTFSNHQFLSVNQNNYISMSGGYLTVNGGTIIDSNTNYTAFAQTGGSSVLSNILYNWAEGGATTVPKISVTGGTITATGITVNPHGTGTNGSYFFDVANDGYNNVSGNLTPGWNNAFPINATLGIYTPNSGGGFPATSGVDVLGIGASYQGVGDGCHLSYNSSTLIGYFACTEPSVAWRQLDIDSLTVYFGSNYAAQGVQFGGSGGFSVINSGIVDQFDIAGDTSGQFFAKGKLDPNKQAWFGIDTTDNIGVLQAYLQGTGAYPFVINPSGGNVGIGTTNSYNTLYVNGGISASGSGADPTTTSPTITMYESGSTGYVDSIATGVAWEPMVLRANTLSVLSAGSTQGLYQASSGNVGIGTTTTPYALTVNGTVSATSFNVGGTAGASSCTGTPTSSFAVTNGIVTHC